jgi:predicted nucleic acid-binding protein
LAGRRFVIDEWLLADARGDNGRDRQTDVADLLEAIRVKCDSICVPLATPWAQKAWDLMRFNDAIRRGMSKQLQALIVNADKCIKVEPGELQPLPAEVEWRIPPDDRYLMQTLFATAADALVTTDETLLAAGAELNLPIRERQEFAGTYLGRFVAP